MISEEDVARIRDEIGRLALQAAHIDLDGFLEVTEAVSSPQALARVVDGLPIRGLDSDDEVHCECSGQACLCAGACEFGASFEWGSVDAGDWQFLCYTCVLRLIERGTTQRWKEVAEDA